MTKHTSFWRATSRVGLSLVALSIASAASAQTSPSADTFATRYDAERRVVGTIAPDPDGSGPIKFAAVRNIYDPQGHVVRIEQGELSAWQAENIAPVNWSGFTIFRVVESTYDVMGRKLSERTAVNSVTENVTQTSYTMRGEQECVAIRMNPATFNSLPASACTLSSPAGGGSFGPDRISRNVYDNAGRVIRTERAVGTALQQNYVSYTYTPNGKVETVTDANGGTARYSYDGHDRLRRWNFPSPVTAGLPSETDYEEYGYDASNNRISFRRRDGSTLTYSYDALSRMTAKVVPERAGLSASQTRDVYYGYDLRGLTTSVRFDSASGADAVITSFDNVGRATATVSSVGGISRTISYQWTRDGGRSRVTHPDGNYFTYGFDGLNRVTSLAENGGVTLATYEYNNRGEMIGMARTAGSTTSLAYDNISRPTALSHNLSGTSADLTTNFAYNPASQITLRQRTNNAFVYAGDVAVARTYTVNGLNQYLTGGPASFSYDANGNLTSDGGANFTYDVENRLVGASGARTAALGYDPLGRLSETSGGTAGITRFLYDGDELIAEYSASGAMLRRYVHGASVDDPLIWYEGANVSAAARRNLFADHQGSIIAVSDGNGAALAMNRYDDWGTPDGSNLGRFGFTGQAWVPELGMYYYKARIYSPTLGRFLQVDPIGYDGGVNLYAYALNDPLNRSDPDGTIDFESSNRFSDPCGSHGGKASSSCGGFDMANPPGGGGNASNSAPRSSATFPPSNRPSEPVLTGRPGPAPTGGGLVAPGPDGTTVRIQPRSPSTARAGYPNGYHISSRNRQPIDPRTGRPPGNVTRPTGRSMTHIPLPENSPFNRLSPLIGGRIVGGVGTFLRIALSTPVAALLYLVTGSPANAPGPEDEIE